MGKSKITNEGNLENMVLPAANDVLVMAVKMLGADRSMIVKCFECGNTFKNDVPADGEIVVCPVCDADYKAVVKNGKVQFEAFIYEEE